MSRGRARLLFVVNADWFFVSHRLALARSCMDAGYEVALCAGESAARAKIEREGIQFLPLPIDRGGTHPMRDAKTIAALVQIYRRHRPDVVHHVTIKPVLYGSLAARALGIRAVVNSVSGLGYAFIPRDTDGPHTAALRTALRGAYRVALAGRGTRVIFQNDEDQRSFVESGLVRKERTLLVSGSGVDLTRFQTSPLPEGDFVALAPSRLLWDKGIGEFVEAARSLKPKYPRARFVLLGRIDPGNPASISQAQVDAWVNEGVVEWWPVCEHEEMPARYRSAHVVVLPSYREGLPLALAEAAASARAVITTDVPGCRDTVKAPDTGWLVPPRDATGLARALTEALEDRAALAAKGVAGRTFAESRFDQKLVFRSIQETYRSLLDGGPS